MDFPSHISALQPIFVHSKQKFMTTKQVARFVATLAAMLLASRAHAQEGPGTRAAGMGGAFVAVADDASAVYWNPAGLASGPVLNLQIDFATRDLAPGNPADSGARAGRHATRLLAVGVPQLGLSYYRLSTSGVTSIPSPAVVGTNDRQEEGLLARRLTTNHFGITLLQSVGGPLAVGTTLKLVRGSVAGGTVSGGTWDEVLDRGGELKGDSRTRADLDVGVMLNAGHVRLGVVGRNLREPNFAPDGEDDTDARLKRQVRLGVAWGLRWPGITPLIASFDADLTKQPDVAGERRDIAAGVETWGGQQRVGLRAGWRASTVGERRPVGTAGVSIAVRRGIFVDAHIARGSDEYRAWSVGGRFTY
jgi:hypothetical protein